MPLIITMTDPATNGAPLPAVLKAQDGGNKVVFVLIDEVTGAATAPVQAQLNNGVWEANLPGGLIAGRRYTVVAVALFVEQNGNITNTASDARINCPK